MKVFCSQKKTVFRGISEDLFVDQLRKQKNPSCFHKTDLIKIMI